MEVGGLHLFFMHSRCLSTSDSVMGPYLACKCARSCRHVVLPISMMGSRMVLM
jgi:hypothetical protein